MRISDWSSDVCSSDLRQVYEQVWAWSLQDTVCGGEKLVRPAGDRKSPSVPVGAGHAKRASSRAVIALAGRYIPNRRRAHYPQGPACEVMCRLVSSEERRGGQGSIGTCRARWTP